MVEIIKGSSASESGELIGRFLSWMLVTLAAMKGVGGTVPGLGDI